jgi:hypothetical protein
VEIHDKLIALLADVEELRTKEAAVKAEKTRHLEQIAQSEGEVRRCNNELCEICENQLRLKREMDGLRGELFAREEDEVVISDDAHIPTEDGASAESGGKRAWKERDKYLKTVR